MVEVAQEAQTILKSTIRTGSILRSKASSVILSKISGTWGSIDEAHMKHYA